jgi:serine/threonine protein phosphatase PrpC
MRRNIVPAVAGSLADVHNDNPLRSPPSKAHIDEALRQALARLDNDLRTITTTTTTTTTTTDARTVPWTTRQAGQAPSTLLAFFDSESRMLRIANAGAGRAFLGRRVTGAGGHECRELTSSGGAQYFDTHSNNARAVDVVEELIDGTGTASPSRGEPDAASVNVESVEVRDGDFLVLGSHDTWSCLDGNDAIQAVSGWIREQEVASTQEQQPVRRVSWWPQDRFLDFSWRDNHGLGFRFDWAHTMVPDLIRDVDKMSVGARGNAASRVLQLEHKRSRDGNDQDFYAAVRPGRTSPAPGSE